MRYYIEPRVVLKSSDKHCFVDLGIVLIGLKYADKLPPHISTNLYHILGRSVLDVVKGDIAASLVRSALETMQNNVGYYKKIWTDKANSYDSDQIQDVEEVESEDKKVEDFLCKLFWDVGVLLAEGAEDCLLECSQAMISPKDRAIADGYLYHLVKNIAAGSAIKYYLHDAPSIFIGILAVGGVQFTTQMAQALLNCDQYVDDGGKDYDKWTNFGCVLSNSLRRAFSGTAVSICVATIAMDQKQLVSQAVMLPTLYCLIEPLSTAVLNYFICKSKLINKPACVDMDK